MLDKWMETYVVCHRKNKMVFYISLMLYLFSSYTGELGYDRPLYDGFLHMTDDMLRPSPMHIKYSSYV